MVLFTYSFLPYELDTQHQYVEEIEAPKDAGTQEAVFSVLPGGDIGILSASRDSVQSGNYRLVAHLVFMYLQTCTPVCFKLCGRNI